jgi:hypothetical protein
MKMKQIIVAGLLTGTAFAFYNVYSFFADDYVMTDEQYAYEAMKIVSDCYEQTESVKCRKNNSTRCD